MLGDLNKLIQIYEIYGFEVRQQKNYLTCLYKKSRYFGVDIIPLSDAKDVIEEVHKIKSEYSSSGYAADIKFLDSVEQAENELYKSFFSYESTITRFKKRYDDFVKKQTRSLLGNQYEYIESPFEAFDGDKSLGDFGLLKTINNILQTDSPQLIILEAAAGYGKTCAAYEILNLITSSQGTPTTPLFTELSKNRGAKIFRYILLDEIDSEFPTLNSDLVIYEIKNGHIPLIIDGFDELLDKVNVTDSEPSKAFEGIETMLDTIGNLLENKTKILLTTRKTAIFSGLEFDKWLQKWAQKFNATRISIKEPKIKDWIGLEKYDKLKVRNIPIQYVANPVLLTYLKNLETNDFDNQIESPEVLIQQYFNRLLEREKERQNLIITVERQYEIFKNVVRMLLEFDITVESKEFFKELIKDQNQKLLEYTKSLYSGIEKPSIENLVDTLATHALLDRKGRFESQIGFINDFVLGVFIGDIICETAVEKIEKDYSYYMLDLACTAYKVQNRKNKAHLWEKVNGVIHKLQPISVFIYDLTLKESLQREYSDLSIYDSTFFHTEFTSYTIKNSVFVSCYFRGCTFDVSVLEGITFIDCIFDNCKMLNDEFIDSSKKVSTIKCSVKDCEILEHYSYPQSDNQGLFDDTEKMILEKLWKISNSSKSQHILKLLQSFEKNQHKKITNALTSLGNKEYLEIRGNQIYFSINKLPIIKVELGH